MTIIHSIGNISSNAKADPSDSPQPVEATHTPTKEHSNASAKYSTREHTKRLLNTKRYARSESGEDATEAQHRRGKLTIWERLDLLLDEDSFIELEPLRQHRASGFGMEYRHPPGDGVVVGWGTVGGRTIAVYGHDFRVYGGSLGEAHAAKIHKIMDMAESVGCPIVSLNDGAGARIQEGVLALAGYGEIFKRNVRASGVIPQISVILGPCAGGATYSPALTDFIFMVRNTAQMFITGPDVVSAVTHEKVTHEELGGADIHGNESGVATFIYDEEVSCLADVRFLIALLPSNYRETPPKCTTQDPATRRNDVLLDLVPADPHHAYDVRDVVTELVDDGDYLELHANWACNIVCALACIDGNVVGIVANQPQVMAGVLDIDASDKAARFVRTCDAFNIPLITLVDVPGFLPGTDQEHAGIIRHGAKLIYAYCSATVPRIQVILRKAYGGSYIVMDSRSIGADLSFAWPINEIAVMGPSGAANIIFRKEIAAAADPEVTRDKCMEEYRTRLANPSYAAENGLVDDLIDPALTRYLLARSLALLGPKAVSLVQRKHGNGPV